MTSKINRSINSYPDYQKITMMIKQINNILQKSTD